MQFLTLFKLNVLKIKIRLYGSVNNYEIKE